MGLEVLEHVKYVEAYSQCVLQWSGLGWCAMNQSSVEPDSYTVYGCMVSLT
jgi:hypothetical protein